MTVRKLSDGQWVADFYTVNRSDGKQGKRVRKKFATKGEALAFENYTLQKFEDSPWLGDGKDKRSLTDLVHLWFDRHGITLRDGEKRKNAMLWASGCMGSPLATEFSAQFFTTYRAKRLDGNFSRTKQVARVSPRTVNLEHAYFLAVFNELKRLGEWKSPNPLENIRQFKTDESEMVYLTNEQISKLLKECSKSSARDLEIIVKIYLATGSRWGEAEKLKHSQIAYGKVTFIKTKGKRNRTIPLNAGLITELANKTGFLFTPCYYAFRNSLKHAEINLPAGQLTHVLRHTFASHFMMNGGNILALQKILGHTDIKMTMWYAHFSPNHLEEAIRFNPLTKSRQNHV